MAQRGEVANTLAFRRRKGTLALLELLADSGAGWPSRAVEFYALLGWTQHINHLRLARGQTVNLRGGDALAKIGTAFDPLAHGVDIRRVNSRRTPGRYNIPSVGLFVWRLKTYSISHAPAYCVESEGSHCFTFSVLGNDAPLYARVAPDEDPSHIADEASLPVPIRRRALEHRVRPAPLETHLGAREHIKIEASAALYGVGKSLAIYAPGWPSRDAPQPVPNDLIVPANLADWHHRAHRGQVLLDPERGRIAFPARQFPKDGVWVDYRYAFSGDIGGGEYHRQLSQPLGSRLYRVSKDHPGKDVDSTIMAAISRWRQDQTGATADDPRLAAVIEIQDSAAYSEPFKLTLEKGEYLQIRAADRTRPVIRLLDQMAAGSDAFAVRGMAGSRLVLDGLLITGRGIQLIGPDRQDDEAMADGDLCDLTIRHTTLVPGWGLLCDCDPRCPNEPSLELIDCSARVSISHSIIGSIHVEADEVQTDPAEISISDSIVDATSSERAAVCAPNLPLAFATLSLTRCTVLGSIETHAITLAENSIFTGTVRVARRQIGCVRFCYVPPGSRTPRRYHCQPDEALRVPGVSSSETRRVTPDFTSERYGRPGYAQLSCHTPGEIRRGADDESEMGAFHDLFQPQRSANLQARLAEYTPAGTDAGIVFEI